MAAALAAAAMSAAAPGVAQAQEAGGVRREGLEEVLVTAQRREQALQEVPLALQVVGTDLIADTAAEDLGDLNGFVPGLLVSSDSPTQPRYQIRGIQTGDFGVGTDPAVGVFVDGIYAARSGASLLAFNDIERIEVLKGPQGTLFGRNSAAGAISIVTRQPADTFEAWLRLRVGDYSKRRVEGMVNLPIGDSFALRVNGVFNQSDGWVEDAATGKDLWPEDNWAGRAALRWDISGDTSATLTWDHDRLDQLARPAIGLIPVTPGSDTTVPYPADPGTFLDPRDARVYNDVIGNEESRTLDQLSLIIDHQFEWATLRSTTAWRQFDTVNREDEDGTNFIATYFDTANIEDNESFYQEFKLSAATDRVDWVAGASYYDEDARQASDTHAFTDSVDTLGINLGLYQQAGLVFPDGSPIRLYTDTSAVLAANNIPATMLGLPWREVMVNDGSFEAFALFGDVIWHLTDRTNLTVGLRYTHDAKEFAWRNGPHQTPELDATVAALQQLGFFDVFPIPPEAFRLDDIVFRVDTPDGGATPVRRSDSWDDLSPRFVLDYAVSPDVMVFGSIAKGYKAGGFNSVEVDSQFDNEEVWNFEAGVRSLYSHVGVILNASDVLLPLQRQAGDLAGERHRRLRRAAVRGRHQRRGGLGHRCGGALATVRPRHAVREPGVHRRHLPGQGDARRPSGGPVGRTDRRAVPQRGARRELHLGPRRVRRPRPLGPLCLPRRVTLQRGLDAPGHLPGEPELRGRRSAAAARPAPRLVERRPALGCRGVRHQPARRPVRDRRQQPDDRHLRHAVRVDFRAPAVGCGVLSRLPVTAAFLATVHSPSRVSGRGLGGGRPSPRDPRWSATRRRRGCPARPAR